LEVATDLLPLLEVPTDMFWRDLPETDLTETEETDLTEVFFPKRVSQKESFWRDFLDGELDLSVSLSTELSSSRLRRITFLPELDLDFLDFLPFGERFWRLFLLFLFFLPFGERFWRVFLLFLDTLLFGERFWRDGEQELPSDLTHLPCFLRH